MNTNTQFFSMKILASFFISFLILNHCFAQDIFIGNWETTYTPEGSSIPIKLSFHIGNPEKNILYPAEMNLQCDSFNAVYHLLLVKRGSRQLAIGKNKFPVIETPYSIGNWTILLNGILDFSKDIKGQPLLTANRIVSKKIGIPIKDIKEFPAYRNRTALQIYNFLKADEIVLKKINNDAWQDPAANKILQPKNAPSYFGIIDTIFVKSKDGLVKFPGNKDIDLISLQINGNNIVDQVDSKKSREDEDFLIDTGLNIITFFADDFGKNAPSGAAVNLVFENNYRTLDFNEKENLAATFIVAKLYLKYDESTNTKFQENASIINQQYYSDTSSSGKGNSYISRLNRTGKVIGNIISKSQQLKFAIWDDAVEDGDSISLSINDKWIVQGFPVKKRPQFITVTLAPGPNIITFVADNLGSIVPNTSVLEIIDGNKRKSFYIETDLHQNELIKIFYDLKPE